MIWAGLGRLPNPKRDVPTIAFESVSAGKRNWKRDYVDKREEYLEAGVVEHGLEITRREVLVTSSLAGEVSEAAGSVASGIHLTPL